MCDSLSHRHKVIENRGTSFNNHIIERSLAISLYLARKEGIGAEKRGKKNKRARGKIMRRNGVDR